MLFADRQTNSQKSFCIWSWQTLTHLYVVKSWLLKFWPNTILFLLGVRGVKRKRQASLVLHPFTHSFWQNQAWHHCLKCFFRIASVSKMSLLKLLYPSKTELCHRQLFMVTSLVRGICKQTLQLYMICKQTLQLYGICICFSNIFWRRICSLLKMLLKKLL